jgi:hypothetical protein
VRVRTEKKSRRENRKENKGKKRGRRNLSGTAEEDHENLYSG